MKNSTRPPMRPLAIVPTSYVGDFNGPNPVGRGAPKPGRGFQQSGENPIGGGIAPSDTPGIVGNTPVGGGEAE